MSIGKLDAHLLIAVARVEFFGINTTPPQADIVKFLANQFLLQNTRGSQRIIAEVKVGAGIRPDDRIKKAQSKMVRQVCKIEVEGSQRRLAEVFCHQNPGSSDQQRVDK